MSPTSAAVLDGAALLERFQALDAFLVEHQTLWRPRPFTERRLPWENQHPALADWLRQRRLEDAEAAHNQPHPLPAPAPFPALAERAAILTELGEFSALQLAPRARLDLNVPGRKWQQIQAFASRLSFDSAPRGWLDWCAGKGHLGRLLASQGSPVCSLEWDAQLVDAGEQLSARLQLPVRHHCQDVMAADVLAHLRADQATVALHACGDLHIRLLRLASSAGCSHIALAPCCYNRIAADSQQPLSAAASVSTLHLSLDDLRLSMQETVTAGARVRRQRDESMARRLAFDLLQREIRQRDEYLPTPSLPPSWLNKPLADYCRDLCELKGLRLDHQPDWQQLERSAWQRLAQVRNLELLRALFRRPLECWLALDRALFLQENGYRTRLGSFCPTRLTPRNLLILAEKGTHSRFTERRLSL
jgi:hypothetical protein